MQEYLTLIPTDFSEFGLIEPLLRAIDKTGYSEPTPIQAKMIPNMLTGRDVIGQAQTGTGKTAAFALPLLNQLQPKKKAVPTILVLTPTRELALQVSESFSRYGEYLKNLRVLPIFGGQDYSGQLQQLGRGVHVIVGTPGRTMDHIRRGSLDLSTIRSIVLDEADEMLKMGFLEDVEWILDKVPAERQIALFSATMPASIRRIAATHLNDPAEITIRQTSATAPTISQNYLLTRGMDQKREALSRLLAAEDVDGMLVFVRTKVLSVELAEYLAGQGHSVTALNGDIAQNQRLRCVEQLKDGKLDILIATDVAARGLDVERVSHVINFDIPFDAESYIHRIGRTGRAGRKGRAILFISPRERGMLKTIERATRQKIDQIPLPSSAEINARRLTTFKNRITETLTGDCKIFCDLIAEYCQETGAPPEQVAAALAKMAHAKSPLFVEEPENRCAQANPRKKTKAKSTEQKAPRRQKIRPPEEGMDRYRIEVGELHGVRPGNIVGAIANEAELSSEHIGSITIFEEHSTVDLPYGMPYAILKILRHARINGRPMRTRREEGADKTKTTGKNGKQPGQNRVFKKRGQVRPAAQAARQ